MGGGGEVGERWGGGAVVGGEGSGWCWTVVGGGVSSGRWCGR